MSLTFDTAYGDTPVSDLDKNQRDWFHPILDDVFRSQSAFLGLVPFAFNLGNVRAKNMTISQLFGVHANFNAIGLRDIWMPKSHIDSRSVQITFNRYAGAVAYHEYDEMITYWTKDATEGQRRNTIEAILRSELGMQAVEVNDYLIRNAYLSGDFKLFAGTATNFAGIGTSDLFDLETIDDIWLGMQYRDVPFAQSVPGGSAPRGSMVCLTTPGVIQNIRQDADWIDVQKYGNPQMLVNQYEVGTYHGVRFLVTPRMTLYNCGEIIAQAALDGAHSAGDGSPDPDDSNQNVDGVYATGQSGMQHYIQLGAFGTGDINDFAVHDIVSIHVNRTNAHGVTNGADYRDGTKQDRRVVAIDTAEDRLVLDRPIMIDMASGYVTKARHVHASLFLGGPGGVVVGVGRGIDLRTPPPVDDFESVHRFSWQMHQGYNVYRPEVFETVFSAGPIRVKGDKVTQ